VVHSLNGYCLLWDSDDDDADGGDCAAVHSLGTAEMQLLSVSSSRVGGAASPRLSSSCGGVGPSVRTHHPADATPATTALAATTTTTVAAAAPAAGADAGEASSSSDSSSDWDEWSDTEQPVSTVLRVPCSDVRHASGIKGTAPFLHASGGGSRKGR